MKIAIFTDTLFPHQVNGVARVASSSAQSLSRRGHDVRVWSVQNVPSLPFWGYPGERLAIPVGKAFLEVKDFNPDIIHAHTPFGLGWEAVIASKLLNIPIVGTHHTFFDHYLKHVNIDFPLMRKISWIYLSFHYNRYDIVLSPSMAILSEMKKNGLKRKTISFSNSVDTEYFIPSYNKNKKSNSLIYMGRVSYEKSIDQVIKAFKIIHDKKPETALTIVGDGPERKKLEELSESLGLKKYITFTGMLHGDAHLEALQNSSIFLTASKTDNMPLAVIEAMCIGLPIVGVDALGIPEMVQNEKNGYIVPVDNPEAMAEKTIALLENDDLRQEFSKMSRTLAVEYGEEKNTETLEKIYNSLIKNK